MMMLAALVGALTWSWMEYVIHRFAGHQHRHNPFAVEHLRHHAEGDYFAPAWKKLGAAVLVCALLGGPAVAVAGVLGAAWVGGFVLTYLGYEWLHWRLHASEGWGPLAMPLRRHHFTHHFHGGSFNHGVTSPLWDHIFGTYKSPPEVIRVPRRLAMRWLVDGDEVRGEFAQGWRTR